MAIWNERIREKRLEKGITLAQIADALGVTEATAQRYESGNIKSVPYEHMCKYGEILGCSPAYLMGWESTSDEDIENALYQNMPNDIISVSEFPLNIRSAARDMMDLSESDQELAINMIRSLAKKGRKVNED